MVLSITYFLLPITPRHRLLVIKYLRFRKLTHVPENAVRVFERTSRAKVMKFELFNGVSRISEVICPFHTGITQPDRSSRQWISKESHYL